MEDRPLYLTRAGMSDGAGKDKPVPRVSEFYGIVVEMFHNEHGPPHFHAKYAEYKVTIGIGPVRVLQGHLPARAERLVIEWAVLHERELADNWERARDLMPVARIAPLD